MLKLSSTFSAIKPFINSSLSSLSESGKNYANRFSESCKHYANRLNESSQHYTNRLLVSSKHYANKLNESAKHYTGRLRDSGKYCASQLKAFTTKVSASGKHYANRLNESSKHYTNRLLVSSKHYVNKLNESAKHYTGRVKESGKHCASQLKAFTTKVSTSGKHYANRLNESSKHYTGRLRESGKHYANRASASRQHYTKQLKNYSAKLSHHYHSKVGNIDYNLREKIITKMLPPGLHSAKLKAWVHSILKMATYNEKKFPSALSSHIPKIKRFGEPEAIARLLTELYVLLLAKGEEKTQPQRGHLIAQFNSIVGRDFKVLSDNSLEAPIDEKLIHSPFIAELANEGTSIQLPSAKLMTVLTLAGMTPVVAWALRQPATAPSQGAQPIDGSALPPSNMIPPAHAPVVNANPSIVLNTNKPITTSTTALPDNPQAPSTNTFEPPFVPLSTSAPAPENPILKVEIDSSSNVHPVLTLEETPSASTSNSFSNLYQSLFTATDEKTVAAAQNGDEPVVLAHAGVNEELSSLQEPDPISASATSKADTLEMLTDTDLDTTTPPTAVNDVILQENLISSSALGQFIPAETSTSQQGHDPVSPSASPPAAADANVDVVGGAIPAQDNASDASSAAAPLADTSTTAQITTDKTAQTNNRFDPTLSHDPIVIQAVVRASQPGDSILPSPSANEIPPPPQASKSPDTYYRINNVVKECFQDIGSDFMKGFYPDNSSVQLSEDQQQAVRQTCAKHLTGIHQIKNHEANVKLAIYAISAISTTAVLALAFCYRNYMQNVLTNAKKFCQKKITEFNRKKKTRAAAAAAKNAKAANTSASAKESPKQTAKGTATPAHTRSPSSAATSSVSASSPAPKSAVNNNRGSSAAKAASATLLVVPTPAPSSPTASTSSTSNDETKSPRSSGTSGNSSSSSSSASSDDFDTITKAGIPDAPAGPAHQYSPSAASTSSISNDETKSPRSGSTSVNSSSSSSSASSDGFDTITEAGIPDAPPPDDAPTDNTPTPAKKVLSAAEKAEKLRASKARVKKAKGNGTILKEKVAITRKAIADEDDQDDNDADGDDLFKVDVSYKRSSAAAPNSSSTTTSTLNPPVKKASKTKKPIVLPTSTPSGPAKSLQDQLNERKLNKVISQPASSASEEESAPTTPLGHLRTRLSANLPSNILNSDSAKDQETDWD